MIAWAETYGNDEGWQEYRIVATRVTPDATALDPDGILIYAESIESTDVHRLEVAAGSGRSQVVWSLDIGGEGGPNAAHVRAARIATDGTTSVYPYDTFPPGLEATAAVHPGGSMLLWSDGDDLWADYPAITGTLLDGADMPVPNSVLAPATTASRQDVRAVASDGQNYFVLWMDTRISSAEGKALYGARVGPLGEPLDAEPILIRDSHTDLVDVVFDGVNYVVTSVYITGGEGSGEPFRTVRVSPAGELLDVTPHYPGLRARHGILAGASDGTHTLLVGADDGGIDLAAVRLNHDGELVGDPVTIVGPGQGDVMQTSVSFDGLGYLVVWGESSDGAVFGHMLTQAGALEGEVIPIAPAMPLMDNEVVHVASAAGGGNHLVVWELSSGIWATRVSPAGQVLDPDGILIVEPELGINLCEQDPELWTGTCASVAFDGENFIVAWRAPSMLGDWISLDLYAVSVSPDGEVSSQLELSQGPEREGPPFLAAGDGRVLAAYSRFVPGSPYDTRRAMARLIIP